MHGAPKLVRALGHAFAAFRFERNNQAFGHVRVSRKAAHGAQAYLEVATHLAPAVACRKAHDTWNARGELPRQRIDVVGRCENGDQIANALSPVAAGVPREIIAPGHLLRLLHTD